MSTLGMSKLKALLQEQALKMGGSGSVPSEVVIEAVRKAHPEAIRAVSRELEDGHMHSVLSRLAGRRPKDKGNQADMFADYPGVRQLIGIEIERDGRRAVEYKRIDVMTLEELDAWLSANRKSSATRRQRERGMVKMLRDLSKAAKGVTTMTVAEAMALLNAQKQKAA